MFEEGSLPDYVAGVEFSGGFSYRPVTKFRELMSAVKSSGRHLLIHGYFPPDKHSFILNFASADEDIVKKSLSLAELALALCSDFEIPYYSFHPGYLASGYENGRGNFVFDGSGLRNYDDALSSFQRNFEKLYSLSQRYGVKLAVENLFINRGGVKDSLNNSIEEIEELISLLPQDTGLLLDLGHMNVSANYMQFSREFFIAKYINIFSERLFEIHLSENNGDFDTHDPLSKGSWQLDCLSKFGECRGVSGRGLNFTLESRKLEYQKLRENLLLIQNSLSVK